MHLIHPRSGRQTPRPGGSRGPSPRSRRCRTCPPRPDIQAAQVLPRSQPSVRSDGPYREPALPPSGPPIPYGKPPEPVSPSTSRLAVLRPVGPPAGAGSRPDRTTCLAAPKRLKAEVIPGTILDFRPAAALEEVPREEGPFWGWAPSRRPCRAVRKPGFHVPVTLAYRKYSNAVAPRRQ